GEVPGVEDGTWAGHTTGAVAAYEDPQVVSDRVPRLNDAVHRRSAHDGRECMPAGGCRLGEGQLVEVGRRVLHDGRLYATRATPGPYERQHPVVVHGGGDRLNSLGVGEHEPGVDPVPVRSVAAHLQDRWIGLDSWVEELAVDRARSVWGHPQRPPRPPIVADVLSERAQVDLILAHARGGDRDGLAGRVVRVLRRWLVSARRRSWVAAPQIPARLAVGPVGHMHDESGVCVRAGAGDEAAQVNELVAL